MVASAEDDPWITPAEESGLTATPSYDETMSWLSKLAEQGTANPFELDWDQPRAARHHDGRGVGRRRPDANRTEEKMENRLILAHAGIHSGEIDGKDAGIDAAPGS